MMRQILKTLILLLSINLSARSSQKCKNLESAESLRFVQ
jgi:hypothetical protein